MKILISIFFLLFFTINADFVDTSLILKVEEKYGIDIDPIGSTTLVMKYNKDSIITEVRKDEYKKNSR